MKFGRDPLRGTSAQKETRDIIRSNSNCNAHPWILGTKRNTAVGNFTEVHAEAVGGLSGKGKTTFILLVNS